MKNIEIKKELINILKERNIQNPKIKVILWHGDSYNYDNAIWNSISLYNGEKFIDMEKTSLELELEDNDENLEMVRLEQKKCYNYLCKHFSNVIMEESNI